MDDVEFLIVGGGPAALSAAREYRAAGGAGSVAIVAEEERMPYQRPPLTKELLRGEMTEAELPIEDESWLSQQQIVLIGGRAVELEDRERRVRLAGGRVIGYQTCLLATGAEPSRPPIPGIDDPAVRSVRRLSHVRELVARLTHGARVVVLGSGFIGCELAASLAMRGHPVTLVSDEPAPNARRLGHETGRLIAGWLTRLGVELALGDAVEAVERRGAELSVTAGSRRLSASLIVAAFGVAPRSELVAHAIGLGPEGTVPVDASMRTALPGLLAAGDVAYALNATAGRRLRVEHWGDALGQGEVAGRTAAGREARWSAVPGFWSSIGPETLKYAAWGDGYDDLRVERHADGLTVWYGRGGQIVGVLTHAADDDYDRGRELIASGASWSEAP